MRAILNIDLKGLSVEGVKAAMHSCGIAYGRHSSHFVVDGDNDWETLAIEAVMQDGYGKVMVFQLAKALGQNCIAMYDLDGCKGSLVGPATSKYAPFDPALFRVV